MPIVVGEIVRYRQEFLSPHDGINYPFADIADMCGEITEIAHDGTVARIRWDDGSVSAARLKNIERADFMPTMTTADEYSRQALAKQAEHALVLIDMFIDNGFVPKGFGASNEDGGNNE